MEFHYHKFNKMLFDPLKLPKAPALRKWMIRRSCTFRGKRLGLLRPRKEGKTKPMMDRESSIPQMSNLTSQSSAPSSGSRDPCSLEVNCGCVRRVTVSLESSLRLFLLWSRGRTEWIYDTAGVFICVGLSLAMSMWVIVSILCLYIRPSVLKWSCPQTVMVWSAIVWIFSFPISSQRTCFPLIAPLRCFVRSRLRWPRLPRPSPPSPTWNATCLSSRRCQIERRRKELG